MIAKYLRTGVDFFQNEKKNLMVQLILFIALPVLYLISISMNMTALGVSFMDIMQKSTSECLNLILVFTSLYSGYIVWQYSKKETSRLLILAYGFVLIAQAMQQNIITLAVMFFYLYHFVGGKGLKKKWQESGWGKDWSALAASLLVITVSAAVMCLRFSL